MIWVKLIQDVLFFAVIMAFVFYLGMVYGKAKPVEKERERGE